MRKFFSILVMICLSLFFFWVVSSWYFGTQAEAEFKKVLDKKSESLGERPFRLELLDYKKHFLGSSASVRVSSDMPLLNDYLGDFVVNLSSLNGPLFLTKKGIDVGSSRWFVNIDPKRFTPESEENLRRIFPEELPVGVLIVGFDKETNFIASIKTKWLESTVSGVYNLSTFSYRGSIDFTKLLYETSALKILADEGKISFQYIDRGDASRQPPVILNNPNNAEITAIDTVSLFIPNLSIHQNILSYPVIVSAKGNGRISIKNNRIDAYSKVKLSQKKHLYKQQEKSIPIDELDIITQINGIQQTRLLSLMEKKAELDNLIMQTQWELYENGEVPEGQDKIWQIQNQINTLNKEYPMILYQTIFTSENPSIATNSIDNKNLTIALHSLNSHGNSSLKGYLKPFMNSKNSMRLADLVEIEAQVDLDDLLYDFIANKSAIRKKQFILNYKQNKLLMH